MKWHKVEERPEESCDCVCVVRCKYGASYVTTLGYSKKHDAFNAHDNQDAEFVKEKSFKTVTHWAYLQEVLEDAID